MEKLYTDFNNKILKEMRKIVDTCNDNDFVIQEVKFINESVGVCQIINPVDADELLSVDLKVVMK